MLANILIPQINRVANPAIIVTGLYGYNYGGEKGF
jgi:hypothetical protein